MRATWKATVVACAAIVAAPGCGGSDDAGTSHPCGETAAQASTQTLAEIANERGIRFGDFYFAESDGGFPTAAAEFNMVTLPVFFRLVEADAGQFDFSLPDAVVQAAPPGTVFYVPGLVWNDLLPDWLLPDAGAWDAGLSSDALTSIMVDYINAVIQHFNAECGSNVAAYEVVLEPLSWQGAAGTWNKIGLESGSDEYDYIRIAFRAARAAAPNTKLYLDDFGAEGLDAKSDQMYQLVSQLKSEDIPIDGVGLECHYMVEDGGAFPEVLPPDEITANMNRLEALGLQTMITSADISMLDSDWSPEMLETQAQGFADLVHACLAAPGCQAFSTWGVGDGDSWIPQAFPGWGYPLLFDVAYEPKPAYAAVKAELSADCAP